jgi:hypothetical protein
MDKRLIRITKNYTIQDIYENNVSTIDVYKDYISRWLINPLKILLNDGKTNFETEFSILSLSLMFFEPHGKYITGNSKGKSKKSFIIGIGNFIDFLSCKHLINNNLITPELTEKIYKLSRCGIFHNMIIDEGILIDSIHIDKSLVFYQTSHYQGILINTRNLVMNLEAYFEHYINLIQHNETPVLRNNFEKTFKEFFN